MLFAVSSQATILGFKPDQDIAFGLDLLAAIALTHILRPRRMEQLALVIVKRD